MKLFQVILFAIQLLAVANSLAITQFDGARIAILSEGVVNKIIPNDSGHGPQHPDPVDYNTTDSRPKSSDSTLVQFHYPYAVAAAVVLSLF
ncbi:hypothetical protein G9P44_001377 [Scheffersomyces stipitis]|nr:hypothetical protein G9P44_001377 [Scheffersomyces stipitis]